MNKYLRVDSMNLIKPIKDHFKDYSKMDIILSVVSMFVLIFLIMILYTIIH